MGDRYHAAIEIVKARYPKHIWDRMNLLACGRFEAFENTYHYADAHVVNGCFNELESFLVEQGIPFDRNSEGFCEIAPECRIFRPNLMDTEIYLNNQGEAHVSTDSLRRVLNQTISDEAKVQQILALVEEVEPQYPELSKYQIQWVGTGDPYTPNDPEAEGDESIRILAVLGEGI